MSFRLLVRILKIRSKTVLIVMLVFLISTILAGAVLPKKYQSSIELLLTPMASSLGTGEISSYQLKSEMATMIDFMASEMVLLSAAKMAGLEQDVSLQKKWMDQCKGRCSFDEYLVESLRKQFVVISSNGSGGLFATFEDRNAVRSAEILNAIAESAKLSNLKIKQDFYKNRLKSLKESEQKQQVQVAIAQSKLIAYEKENNLVITDAKYDVENVKLSLLNKQLVLANSQKIQAQGDYKTTTELMPLSSQIAVDSAIRKLEGDVINQSAKLKEVEGLYGRNHVSYQSANIELIGLQDQLTSLKTILNQANNQQAKISQANENELRHMIEQQTKSILSLRNIKDQYAFLLADLKDANKNLNHILETSQSIQLQSQSVVPDLVVLKKAIPSNAPVNLKTWVLAIIAIPLGLLIGSCVGLLQELVSRRVRMKSDLQFGMFGPVIGVLDSIHLKQRFYASQNKTNIDSKATNFPTISNGKILERFLLPSLQEDIPEHEQLNAIRSNLLIAWLKSGPANKSIAIVSADRNEGRSFLSANLALSFAQLGKRTLLIDADMRHPVQHIIFKLENQLGLADILKCSAGSELAKEIESVEFLTVLPAGNANDDAENLLSSAQFSRLIEQANLAFDVIVIDCPSAQYENDMQLLSEQVGKVLVVVRENFSLVRAQKLFVKKLQQYSQKLIGVVLNDSVVNHG